MPADARAQHRQNAPPVHPKAVAVAVARHHGLTHAIVDQAYEELTEATLRALHWSVPDPAGTNTAAAFEQAFTTHRWPRPAGRSGPDRP